MGKLTKFSKGVMFFGVIGVNYKFELVKCSAGVNSDEYLQNVYK